MEASYMKNLWRQQHTMDNSYSFKNIKELAKHIEELTGLDCYSDDIETNEFNFGDFGELGITIEENNRISIFRSFGYYDLPQDEQDKESQESDNLSYAQESAFYFFLKCNQGKYAVSRWDDGGYMCPGYVARIGFYNIAYSDEAISFFLKMLYGFRDSINEERINELRKYIVKAYYRLFHDYDIMDADHSGFTINFNNISNANEVKIDKIYEGKEYYLLQAGGDNYAAHKECIQWFLGAVKYSELGDCLVYTISNGALYVKSNSMTLTLSCYKDEGMYYKLEEFYLINTCSGLVPFSSDEFQNAFVDFYRKINSLSAAIFIITEGCTDWIHLKKHWELLKNEYTELDLAFLEYNNKTNMGSSVLLEMCRSFSKIHNEKKFILIFDRDEPKIIKQVIEDGKTYKKWGNNVYSMAIPIPDHRNPDDAICIEHLYLDSEIKKEYICEDGVARRVYLGNEFDEYGRNLEDQKICTKCRICGSNSLKIIDGSSDARVVSSTSSSTTNYALSKFDFADKVIIDKKSKSYLAFKKVFDIIYDIDKIKLTL